MYHSSLTDLGPVVLRSNEFWGSRSGSISKSGERIFLGKKMGGGTNNSRTPSKKRTSYANKKLQRQSARGHVVAVRKGSKVIA